MSNILITGGAGFIGSHIAHQLKEEDHNITIFDNFTNYDTFNKDGMEYLFTNRLAGIDNENRVVPGDIEKVEEIEKAFDRGSPEVVIHAASFPRQKLVNMNPKKGSEVMMTGLINLLEECTKNNVQRFVYISSSMVYGDFNTAAKETDTCNPIGQYAIMKLAGEQLVKDYARRTGMEYTIIRPSAVYGPWDVTDRVISQFIVRALKDEELIVKGQDEVLDFTYVKDVANGIALAATSNVHNNTYNITRGTERHTLLNAANIIVHLAGAGSIKTEERDLTFPTRNILNIDKARDDLNYNPAVDLHTGLEKYVNWYKQHRASL